MALQTFDPSPGPAPGSKKSVTPRILVAEFGDGYTQRAADGLNAMKQQWDTLVWQNLRKTEAVNLEQFFEGHAGYKAFFWTPPGYETQLKFVCTQWSRTYVDHDIYTVDASFTEVKDLGS